MGESSATVGEEYLGELRCQTPGSSTLAKAPSISANGIPRASPAKVPCSAISVAAWTNAPQATRASPPPTLIRRTPRSARAATVVKSLPTRALTGFGATELTAAAISSRVPRGGAGPAHAEPLRSPRQQHPTALVVDRLPGGTDPSDRQVEVEQWFRRVTARILDRHPRDAGPDGARNVRGDTGGVDRESPPETGVDRA